MKCHWCKERLIDYSEEGEKLIQIIVYDHMLFHPSCLPYWKEKEEKKQKAREERKKEKEKKDEVLSQS